MYTGFNSQTTTNVKTDTTPAAATQLPSKNLSTFSPGEPPLKPTAFLTNAVEKLAVIAMSSVVSVLRTFITQSPTRKSHHYTACALSFIIISCTLRDSHTLRKHDKAITYENPRLSKKQRLELEQVRGHPMTWRRYHRYADILRYLEYLHHSYSELVELVPLGRSSEGLPLVAVKISMPSNDSSTKNSNEKGYKKRWKLRSRMKPAVWIDGGTHAREWIAPAVATWMLHSLVEGETKSGSDMDLLEQADFYIMPVLNPDGYEHSHTYDRLWRKTRSRASDHDEDYYTGWFPWNWGKTECMGVDADRNWDYRWGEQDSSRDPCMDNYAGSHPFSEPETRAVSEFLAEHRGQIKVFISLHAYSQAWLVPSSHAQSSFTDDGLLMEMGKLATAALADSFGTKYRVGTVAELRQPASGMSHDWAKSRAGIKYSYHVDLRDSFGPYGFLLPGSQIVSTARETWQAIKAIVDNISAG
nr:M14 metal carboxypeptidase 5 [Antheraea pernyi]